MLLKWGLIEVNGDQDSKYEATERGIEFLSTFKELQSVIGNGKAGK